MEKTNEMFLQFTKIVDIAKETKMVNIKVEGDRNMLITMICEAMKQQEIIQDIIFSGAVMYLMDKPEKELENILTKISLGAELYRSILKK